MIDLREEIDRGLCPPGEDFDECGQSLFVHCERSVMGRECKRLRLRDALFDTRLLPRIIE